MKIRGRPLTCPRLKNQKPDVQPDPEKNY